jgi:hypothetical protein
MTSYITNVMRKTAEIERTIRKRDEKEKQRKPRQGMGLLAFCATDPKQPLLSESIMYFMLAIPRSFFTALFSPHFKG